jgi:hypothetical protein
MVTWMVGPKRTTNHSTNGFMDLPIYGSRGYRYSWI